MKRLYTLESSFFNFYYAKKIIIYPRILEHKLKLKSYINHISPRAFGMFDAVYSCVQISKTNVIFHRTTIIKRNTRTS